MPKMNTLTINNTTYDIVDDGVVRFDSAQTLTDEQKAQARENIGAFQLFRVLENDPTSMTDGDAWIIKNTPAVALTDPVISTSDIDKTSASILLNNPSYDEFGSIVNKYNVYLDDVLFNSASLAPGENYIIDGLSRDTSYNVSLRGVKGNNMSETSNIINFITDDVPLGQVEGIVTLYKRNVVSEGGKPVIVSTDYRSVILCQEGEYNVQNNVENIKYYPIAVPRDATSVIVNCGGLMFGYNGWNRSANGWSYDVDSGWKNSGATYTFQSGSHKYATIGLKRTDNAAMQESDISNITVTFA